MTNGDHAREREMAIEIAKGIGMLKALRITRGCFDYLGGYSGRELEIYHHGIDTVVHALEDAIRDPKSPQVMALEASALRMAADPSPADGGKAALETKAWTPLGVVARAAGEQTQYVSRFLMEGDCFLAKGLRFSGRPADYHDVRVHPCDVASLVARIKHWRDDANWGRLRPLWVYQGVRNLDPALPRTLPPSDAIVAAAPRKQYERPVYETAEPTPERGRFRRWLRGWFTRRTLEDKIADVERKHGKASAPPEHVFPSGEMMPPASSPADTLASLLKELCDK